MGNNKKSQRARQRKSKDEYLASLKSAATSVTEMLTYMPGLNARTLDMEKAILAAPDYNYYEKLQLRHIWTAARDALVLLSNTEQARSHSPDTIKALSGALRDHMVWLINTTESINSGDTGWSDLVAEVLESLHDATDAAGDYGPAWLEYSWDDVDDTLEGAKAAAAAQLEREGLAVRRKKMFTATRRRRWQALEMQMEEDQEEAQELAEEEAEAENNTLNPSLMNPAAGRQQQHLDSTFHAAAMTDATTLVTLEEESDMLFPLHDTVDNIASEQAFAEALDGVTGADGSAAAAGGDVYTSMAADLAEFEAEIAARQQQQQSQWDQDFPPLQQQQQQQQSPPRAPSRQQQPSPQQQQQPPPSPPRSHSAPAPAAAAGRGRGRGRGRGVAAAAAGGRGRGGGRGSAGPDNSRPLQQQQQPSPRQQQQQQPTPQQQEEEYSKTDSMGPPTGWSPEFAGTGTTVRSRSAPVEFEPCFRSEDFLADDVMPDFDNLTPVITREVVAMEAVVARMKLESVVTRRGGGSSLSSSTSRTGASVFLTTLRTDPDMTVYERVMVTRWWRALNPLAHWNPVTASRHTNTQQILLEQYHTVQAADAWIDDHLCHLMPYQPAGTTREQLDNRSMMDRLHKAAAVLLEAFQRNQWIPVSRLIMELHLELPQALIAAEPGSSGSNKAAALAQRTIAQLVTDGLCRREVVGRSGQCVICQLPNHEWRRAMGYLARG